VVCHPVNVGAVAVVLEQSSFHAHETMLRLGLINTHFGAPDRAARLRSWTVPLAVLHHGVEVAVV
jgi:hypothetical protein